MKAEIVSVGTELLLGEITDTNASYLADQLPPLGIDLYWISQVGDNRARLVGVLERAWQRSDLILVTGGLGPTEDDLTREAIAEMMGEELRIDPLLESEIRELFAHRSVEMAPSNIKQAAVIPSARAMHNARGTAPGWWVERDGHILVAMPGPPGEMHRMWCNEVLPELNRRTTGLIIFSKTLKVFGLPEGTVGELVSPWLSSANPTLGIYAKIDGVHLRFTAKAQSREEAEGMIAQGESQLRSVLGESIWGTDDDTLASVVGHALVESGLSLAVVECGSGGLLTATIVEDGDATTYFKGGLVAGSNEALVACGVKAGLLHDYGVVSPEVAPAMAGAARLGLAADIGVGVTAGVEAGGIVYIGMDDGRNMRVTRHDFPADRPGIKLRVASSALFELRKMLLASG